MGTINTEGQHVGHHAGFLDGSRGPVAVGSRVEVGIECAAVQLHKIQDGRRQFLHYFFCEGAKMRDYTKASPARGRQTDAAADTCLFNI